MGAPKGKRPVQCVWGGCSEPRVRWIRWARFPQTDGYCDLHADIVLSVHGGDEAQEVAGSERQPAEST